MLDSVTKKRVIEKKFQYNIYEQKSELERLRATQQAYEKRRIGKKSLITDEYSLHWRHMTNNIREDIVRENESTYRRRKINREHGEKESKKLVRLIGKLPRLSDMFPNQLKPREKRKSKKFQDNPMVLFPPQNRVLVNETSGQDDPAKVNMMRLPLGNSNWFLNDSGFYQSDETFFAETLAKIHSNTYYSFNNEPEIKQETTVEESDDQSSQPRISPKIISRNRTKEQRTPTKYKFPPLYYAVEKIKRQKMINEKNGLYRLDPIMRRDLERPRFPTLEINKDSF